MHQPLGGVIIIMKKLVICLLIEFMFSSHYCNTHIFGKEDLTIKINNDSLINTDTLYLNENLGISFPYDKMDYDPAYENVESNHFTEEWETFSSQYMRLSFNHPKELVLKVIKRLDNFLDLDSDSTIQLGYYLTKHYIEWDDINKRDNPDRFGEAKVIMDSTFIEFVPIVEIFSSKRTFNEICEYEGFVKRVTDTQISDSEDKHHSKHNWKLTGKFAEIEDSYYLDGTQWKGLYGYNFTRLSHGDGTYSQVVPFRKIFLRKKWYRFIHLIFSFYDGPDGNFEDEVRNIINMEDFFKIVSSVRYIER